MNPDLHAQLAEYGKSQRSRRRPVGVAEIARDTRAQTVAPTERPTRSPNEAICDKCGAELMVFDLIDPIDAASPARTRRWPVVVGAVAALVFVVWMIVLAELPGGNVTTESTSSPIATEPSPPISATLAPVTRGGALAGTDVGGPPECESSTAWARVCDVVDLEGGVMYAVSAGGQGFVAVGSEELVYDSPVDPPGESYDAETTALAAVWTSPDGLAWARVPHDEAVFGGPGTQQMFSVTLGGPGLVAVGRDGPAVNGEGRAAVWTSPDGQVWSRVPHDETVFGGLGEQRMLSVTAGGPGLVAVGFDGPRGDQEENAAVWTSVDGLTWSRVPHDEAVFGGLGEQRMLSVAAGGPGLVAVGSVSGSTPSVWKPTDAAVWTSVDGLTWSRVPHDLTLFGKEGSRTDRNVIVASGTDRTMMLSVIARDSGLVAVGFNTNDQCGYNGAVWASPDGLSWSRVRNEGGCGSSDSMRGVAVGRFGGLVAVGDDQPGGEDSVVAAVWIE